MMTVWKMGALAVCALLTARTERIAPTVTTVTIAAAASTHGVLPELARVYEAAHPGVRIAVIYGASGDLKKQVEGGAPIDGVIFASGRQVDELIAEGRVDAASRAVLATNELVLIGCPCGQRLTFRTIDTLPAGEKVAVGDPDAVPVGQYTREYLEKLGKWKALEGRLVFGGDVSAVLEYARRGDVAAAVVYRSDVMGINDVAVLDEAHGPDAPRPAVVAGVVSDARVAGEAGRFLAFAGSAEGRKLFAEFGFGAP